MVATWSLAAAKWSIHRLWRGATCYGAATFCAERILSAYEFTVSIFYVLQKVLIVVFEINLHSDKSRFDFWPSAISIFDPLTFFLTEDEDQSTEYIGVPPPWIFHCCSQLGKESLKHWEWTYVGYSPHCVDTHVYSCHTVKGTIDTWLHITIL